MNTKKTPNIPKILWIEELRILAAFAIVLLHVASVKVKSTTLLYEDCYVWLSFYHTVTRFAVNCFVMITGALLLRPEKELTISQMLKKYLPKVIILFGVWSAIYVAADSIEAISAGKNISFSSLCKSFISGHYHMWYLYMLAGLYLITPFLKELVKNKKLVEYFLILGIIFYLLPSTLQLWTPVYNLLQTITNSKMIFHFIRGYVLYYLMGHYLTTYELKKWQKYTIYLGGILGILYGIWGGIYFSRAAGATTQVPYNNGTINIFLFSSAVFLFFLEYRSKKAVSEKRAKLLTCLGSSMLGVYLLHPLFVDAYAAKAMAQLEYEHLWLVLPALAFVIFLLCLVLSFFLKKIPILGKYLV